MMIDIAKFIFNSNLQTAKLLLSILYYMFHNIINQF
jgi:hypothetical protein